jgi:hypothetical protein
VQLTTTNPVPLVLVAGAITSALALAGVWALSAFADENVMGWYANYVLPAGAILVGLVASSGFGLGSYLGGAKITGGLLVAVAALLLLAYWGAQLIDFRLLYPDGAFLEDGTEVGLLAYYDAVTRTFAWEAHGRQGAALGAWGYALRVGEVVGFTGGGLIVPVLMRTVPYCAACRVYMRRPLVAVLPAGVAPRRFSKKQTAEREALETRAGEELAKAQANLERLFAAGRAGDDAAFRTIVAEAGPLTSRRAAEKLGVRIHVRAVHCRRCGAGELAASLAVGQGRELRITPLASQPLERGVVPRLARSSP